MSGTAFERVKAARSNSRPTGKDYIDAIFTDFFELHGDRRCKDDPAIVGGVAWLGGQPVTVIAMEKGHSAKERLMYRNKDLFISKHTAEKKTKHHRKDTNA